MRLAPTSPRPSSSSRPSWAWAGRLDRRSDWASVAPLKCAAVSTGWGGRTVVGVGTKRGHLRIARNRGGRIATSSALGKPPQRLVAVTQQLVADGDLVEELGDRTTQRRRL